MSSRVLAAEVLFRVWTDDAYAAPSLSKALDGGGLSPRDRALCTELVYGVLRTQPYLERRLTEFAKLKLSDRQLLALLLVAAYQIEFLDRIPSRAAVNEAVSAITSLRDSRVGGFANAILRKVSDSVQEKSKTLVEATFESSPSWLRKRLIRDLGEEGARALLSPHASPKMTLRLRRGEAEPAFFEKEAQKCAVPGAYRYLGRGDPRRYPEFSEGKVFIQELGAQLVAHSLGAMPGDSILDVCAGRGQKSSLLFEQVGSTGRVMATDLHQHKVDALRAELQHRGQTVEARVWDWSKAPPVELCEAFDRVIVDAPCTGVGTIHRRPEIARRLGSEDPSRLGELQELIVTNAAQAVKPGGILLFATCSVLKEEGEIAVERLIADGAFLPAVISTDVDGLLFPGGSEPCPHFRLLPHIHGTDGYSIVRLRRS